MLSDRRTSFCACTIILLMVVPSFIPEAAGGNECGSKASSPMGGGRAANGTTPVWPMSMGNARHTGLSPFNASDNPGKVRWQFTENGSMGAPVIGPDGTIYACDWAGNLDAFDQNGVRLWNASLSRRVYEAPAISPDGTVYIAHGKNLSAFDLGGRLKWTYLAENELAGSPTIGPDGTVYSGTWANISYAVNPNGTLKWRFPSIGRSFDSPSIGPDGTLFIASSVNYTYAIDPNGSLKWQYDTGKWMGYPPTIGDEGTLYVSAGDAVIALNYTGALLWTCGGLGYVNSQPALGPDGTIYVGCNESLQAISKEGDLKWRFQIPKEPWLEYYDGYYDYATGNEWTRSLAVSADGIIFAGCLQAGLFALFPNGSVKWRLRTDGYESLPPAIGTDGTVYFSAGYLYAVGKTVPSPPRELENTQLQERVHLAWKPPADDGGANISAFRVYRGTGGGNEMQLAEVAGAILSYADPTAPVASNLTYFVTAINAIGESARSNIVRIPATVPTAPRNLRAFSGDGMVHLSWEASIDDGGTAITGYRAYRSVQGLPPNILVTSNGSISSIEDLGLVNGLSYSYHVTATNSIGESPPSNSVLGMPVSSGSHTPWAMEGHDARHTGRSAYSLATNPGALKWSFQVMGGIDINPVIGYDGTIYFACQGSLLHAVDMNGTVKWIDILYRYSSWSNILSATIGLDGTLFYATYDGVLLRYDSTGNASIILDLAQKSGPGLPSTSVSAPTIGPDGTLYLLATVAANVSGCWTYTGKLLALDPDGKIKWEYQPDDAPDSPHAPAVDGSGVVYFIGGSNITYAVGPGGVLKWRCAMEGWYGGSPSLADDGTIYSASDHGCLHAFAPDGTLRWIYNGSTAATGPAIGPDGTVFFGATNGSLLALTPEGNLKWRYITSREVAGSPVVDSDGSVCFNCWDGRVYLLNPNGTLKWNYFSGGGGGTPAIGSDGTIYVGIFGGGISVGGGGAYLLAIGESGWHPLSAPLELRGAAGIDCINLTWQPPLVTDNLMDYAIYRNSTYLAVTVGNTTFFSDKNVNAGAIYTYLVAARTANEESPRSNQVSVRMPSPPSAPQNLQGKYEKGKILLSWQEPSDNGSLPIIGYRIYRGRSAGNITFLAAVNGSNLSYIDALTNQRDTYFYRVSAVNAIGEGSSTPMKKVSGSTGKVSVPGGWGLGLLAAAVAASLARNISARGGRSTVRPRTGRSRGRC